MESSPNGLKLAAALNNGTISLIDTRTGKILGVSLLQHADICQVMVSNSCEFYVNFVDCLVGQRLLRKYSHRPSIDCLANKSSPKRRSQN